MTQRRVLQVLVAVLALVPIGAGLGGFILGTGILGLDGSAADDSHFRYLSGLLAAIGFGFWSTIRNVEQKAPRFQLLTMIVITGGLARLASAFIDGALPAPTIFALMMELVVTPLLCLWQRRIARAARVKLNG